MILANVKIGNLYLLKNGKIGWVGLIHRTTVDLIIDNTLRMYTFEGHLTKRMPSNADKGFDVIKQITQEENPEYFL